MSTVFPPLTNSITWTNNATDANGQPLPAGEALVSTTLGVRADLDAAHGPGNYQYLVIVPAPASSETVAALAAALGKTLPPGNYWLNAMQTDALNGVSVSSAWMGAETPFSVPPVAVAPGAPVQLSVA